MNNLIERAQKLLRELNNRTVVAQTVITDIKYLPCDYKTDNTLPELSAMQSFDGKWGGANDTHAWFSFDIDAPSDNNIRNEVFVDSGVNGWDLSNPQFLVYVDGKIAQGLDTNHCSFIVDSGKHTVYLYAYAGYQISPLFAADFPLEIFDYNNPLTLSATLQAVDICVETLANDVFVMLNTLSAIKTNTKQYADILNYVNAALNMVDFVGVSAKNFGECCKKAHTYLKNEYFGKYCKRGKTSVSCVGHTHIDVAWLWPVRQTREKAQRSFATVLALMDRYPDYKFMSSQCYLYRAVKEEAPELYERIKQRVAEGRWDVEGAMWLEADCNLISGESLVRQILYGKRFMKREFGVDSKVLWLPDVFGYSAALPQILKQSGVETFVTSKISWNDTNVLPYDMFRWKGLDGSEVFTYFLTAPADANNPKDIHTNYNAIASPVDFLRTYNRMQQKSLTNEVLMDYGYGDGGGGPTAQFIENIGRMQCGAPDFPYTKFERASDFFARVRKKVYDNPELPRWTGELYLEYHRGTYTSVAKNKRNNRRAEYALQNLEKLFVLANKLGGVEYPRRWFEEMWQMVLTNQFHDIIPGSSVTEVYNVTDREYAKLFDEEKAHYGRCLSAILPYVSKNCVLNLNSMPIDGYVKDGEKYVYVEGAKGNAVSPVAVKPSNDSVKTSVYTLENKFFRIKFGRDYDIAEIFDKRAKRNVLRSKAQLKAYEDYPNMYEAWEIRNYYTEKQYELTFVSVENIDFGGKKGKRIVKKVGESTVTTDVCLYDYTDRIDFDTTLDWQTPHLLLKTLFPLDVNAHTATCDVQFGNVARPTTCNNSWDEAKFEFCAHKYVDISEGNFGVALLNDCKYGYSARDNVLSLTLIKCSTNPSDCVDKGVHKFTYALYPHVGDVRHCDVYKHATLLNNPLVPVDGTAQSNSGVSLVSCDKDNVIVDTVKFAEDDNRVIVRLFENNNCTTNCTLTFGLDVLSAVKCDLLENDGEKVAVRDNKISLTVKPFEIVSLKLTLK